MVSQGDADTSSHTTVRIGVQRRVFKLSGAFRDGATGRWSRSSPKDGPTAASMNSCHGPGAPLLSRKRHDDLRPSNHAYEFLPEHFFAVYPLSLHIEKPKYDSDAAPLNEYPANFGELSERLRRESGWKCQNCHRILSDPRFRQFLHVHHVNGVRSDNTRQNLKVLCIACHAGEPRHQHIRNTPAYAELLKLKAKGKLTCSISLDLDDDRIFLRQMDA